MKANNFTNNEENKVTIDKKEDLFTKLYHIQKLLKKESAQNELCKL